MVKGQLNSKKQEEGLWEWFWENGIIHFRSPYKRGKIDGIEEWFYLNGNIRWRTTYKDGVWCGIQTFYDEQGNITETRNWKDGKLIEETKPELTPHIEYWPNGNVWIKGQKNSKGQREGIWEWFCPNGNISWRTPYKEGNEDGIEELFDKQGNIIRTFLWKDGELIETTQP
jgi:antitoxin component YwqK of YwqJK toxin-antitoxin module